MISTHSTGQVKSTSERNSYLSVSFSHLVSFRAQKPIRKHPGTGTVVLYQMYSKVQTNCCAISVFGFDMKKTNY